MLQLALQRSVRSRDLVERVLQVFDFVLQLYSACALVLERKHVCAQDTLFVAQLRHLLLQLLARAVAAALTLAVAAALRQQDVCLICQPCHYLHDPLVSGHIFLLRICCPVSLPASILLTHVLLTSAARPAVIQR
jgi:hypothetical protein